MLEPGAKISTTLPKFENEDRASVIVEDPTVMAAATRAVDWFAALVLNVKTSNSELRIGPNKRTARPGGWSTADFSNDPKRNYKTWDGAESNKSYG